MKPEFALELKQLINKHSVDNYCETPDYILADMLVDILEVIETGISVRDRWFGNKTLSEKLKLREPLEKDAL